MSTISKALLRNTMSSSFAAYLQPILPDLSRNLVADRGVAALDAIARNSALRLGASALRI